MGSQEFLQTHFSTPGWRKVATCVWQDSLRDVKKAIKEEKAKKEKVKRQKAEARKLKKANKLKLSKLSQVEN